MGGWRSINKDEIQWDGTIRAIKFEGVGAGGAESDPVFIAWKAATPPIYTETDPLFMAASGAYNSHLIDGTIHFVSGAIWSAINSAKVTSLSVSGAALISGAITLSEGTNITLEQAGQNIKITSSGGAAVVYGRSLSIPVVNPTSTDNFLVYRFSSGATITGINAVCMDGTSISFKLNECNADGASAAQICDTCTATTTNTAANITNAGIDAGNYISYTSSATSGAITKFLIAMDYTIP